jgi:hypothetical protein
MKNDDPLEKVIEKKVCDYAKSKGFVVYKFASFNNAGVPDRIMIRCLMVVNVTIVLPNPISNHKAVLFLAHW